MKLLVLVTLVAAAAAAPQSRAQQPSRGQNVELLRYDFDDTGAGYKFGYEQNDGQRRDEQAELKNPGTDNEFLAVKGSYSWFSPEGIQYIVNYVADDNGYQPNVEQGPGTSPAALASILGG